MRDDVWPESWDDVFVDYGRWQEAGEPEGYVWGTNWSLAYPGIRAVEPSHAAETWSQRLRKPFFEVELETDRFKLSLIFHSIRHAKSGAGTETVSQAVTPLD